MSDEGPNDGGTGQDGRDDAPATAPALVTMGLTPDVASPQEPPLSGESDLAPTVGRGFIARLITEPMWVLGLVILMDEMDKNIVRGLIPQLKAEFGVGDLGIGVLLSLALLFNGIITVPAGYLADRWNRTQAIGKTVIGWSILSAAGAASVGFPMLVGMRSALGFGQAITEPSAASLIGDYYPPDQRGKAFSIQQVMLLAGTGVGVGLGGLIGTTLGWRPAFVIVAIPGLLVSMLVFRLREPKRGTADMMAAIGAGSIEHADEHADLFERGFGQFCRDMLDGLRADMRTILNIRTMRYALVGVAALLFTITAIAAWLPQFYERQLYAPEGRGEGIFFLIVILGGVPGVLVGGRIADKYAPRMQGGRLALPAIFLFVGTALFTASYLIHADSYTMAAIVPCFLIQLVALFVVTLAIPGLRAGLTDAIPAHLRGAGFGAFNLVSVIFGMAAAPFIVGALSSMFDDNLRVAFLIVSPFSFLGAAVLYRARKFLDEDMQKIMMAVLVAMQEERDRAASAAESAG
ncbi:MAG: MFS transporter [Acidimicrobiales bacterium]